MSVDVWIFGSIAFIASSLIELAIVGHLHRQNRSRRSARRPTVFLEQEQGMFQNSTGTSAPATPGLVFLFLFHFLFSMSILLRLIETIMRGSVIVN